MYNHVELMVDRLTDNYNKGSDSGIMKLIKIMAEHNNDNETSYQIMRQSQDVDDAVGSGLDVIGRNVGISRGAMQDDQFRRMIKIKIIANMSNGDIPTLNKIFRAYLGDQFKGVQEGWKSVVDEPAALVLKVGHDVDLKYTEELGNVVAGGVALYTSTEIKGEVISLVGYSYDFDVPLPICNTFRTAAIPGRAIKLDIVMADKSYVFDVPYPVCNTFRAGGR